jgi:hypothetical protein
MFGSTRTVQVTPGLRQMAAAIVTFALATILALVVAIGQFTASKPVTAPAAAPAPLVQDHGSGGGGAGRLIPQ